MLFHIGYNAAALSRRGTDQKLKTKRRYTRSASMALLCGLALLLTKQNGTE